MNVSSDLPGFQFYTANNLGKDSQPLGKDGKGMRNIQLYVWNLNFPRCNKYI